MDKKIFNSKTQTECLELHAPYYNAILPTTVLFENEGISVYVDSLGHVEFFDSENNSLGFVDIPAAESPDMYAHSGQYGTVKCISDGNTISIHLPVYGWEDSYPHCDGESDRWSRYEVRWFRVEFDCKSRKIEVVDR